MAEHARWTYEHSDAVVEGSRAKYREMERRAGDLARGAPVLLEGDAGETEEGVPPTPTDDGEPASPDELLTHTGGGWYEVGGLEEKVRGHEEALTAARELLEGS